jgi:hypothetical protein
VDEARHNRAAAAARQKHDWDRGRRLARCVRRRAAGSDNHVYAQPDEVSGLIGELLGWPWPQRKPAFDGDVTALDPPESPKFLPKSLPSWILLHGDHADATEAPRLLRRGNNWRGASTGHRG